MSMLLPLGFELVEAENGLEGLQKGMKTQPDIILLDLKMPGIDGFEVARRIRRNNILHSKPVMAVSANAFEDTRRKSFEAGCTDFLAKPFELPGLLSLLQSHLHLEWEYGETRREAETRVEAAAFLSESAIIPPEIEHELLHRATRGDIKGILYQLDKLERSGDEFAPFVKHVKTLAKTFQVDRIVNIFETMEKPKNDLLTPEKEEAQ